MDSSFETGVRQFFVLHFKWTPTREEHKIFVSVFEWITLFCKTWRFQTDQNIMLIALTYLRYRTVPYSGAAWLEDLLSSRLC
jgi:hypothetical protein